jgi:hypothetical protein
MLSKILWLVAILMYVGAVAGLLGAGLGATASAGVGATLFALATLVALMANFLSREPRERAS